MQAPVGDCLPQKGILPYETPALEHPTRTPAQLDPRCG